MNYINKEHKCNISIKQQIWFSFIQKSYDKVDIIRMKDCLDTIINFVIRSQMPYFIVNSFWFKKLCNILNQRYVLPSY